MKVDRDTLRGALGVIAALGIIALIYLLKPGIGGAPDFPCNPDSSDAIEIDIRAGESGSEIAKKLFTQGVTASYESFFRVAVGDERSNRIAPGVHLIDRKICAANALNQLLDSKRIANLISIPEGAWISEIKESLAKVGFSSEEVNRGFADVSLPSGYSTLEGLLFPAQYSFGSNEGIDSILDAIVKRGLTELREAGLAEPMGKFSPQELLTVASLIQAEGDVQDYRKISQVIRNRLSIGMPLQFDSTVHYIKGTRGSVFLSSKSTLINSAYNTYRRYGLPPGPINNPGREAMQAAINPAPGNWLFFITVAPGDTRFTDSIEIFNQWKVLYKKNLRAGKFGK
ncbi:MAG: hypothetical protein RLZZ364_809 [Actinomycetota bacterium]